MRILALLWTVCLVKLCYGVEYDGAQGGLNGTERQDPPGPTITPITLDLANPDDSKIKIGTKEDKGLKHTTYTPKSGSKMTSVVDGQTSIWTASEKEKFVFAELSSKGESSLLLISTNTGIKHLKKNGSDEWKSIEKDLFLKKLKDLKNGVTNQSSLQGSATLRTDNPTVVPSSDEFSEAQMVKQGGTTLDLENTQSPENLFEKADGKWVEIKDFLKELNEMSKSGSSPGTTTPS